MSLIDKHSVNAELFKSNGVISFFIFFQFSKFAFNFFEHRFGLFDSKSVALCVFLKFIESVKKFVALFQKHFFSTFLADRNFVKLTVTNDNSIPVLSGNARTKFFPVASFKIFFGGD